MKQSEHANNSQTSRHLWDEFRRGNLTAYEELYRQYFPTLYDYGLKLTGDQDLVLDCLQEFFLRMWQRHAHYDVVRHVKAYLLTGFRRSLFSYMEKHRNLALREENYAQFQPDMVFSVERDIVASEEEVYQTQVVQGLLAELSPRQKEVVYLRFFRGLSPQEVSDVLGLNYQTVINHFHDAIKTLRKHKPTILRSMLGCITFLWLLG